MKQDIELWQFIYERLEQNTSVMLLVVATSSGSSPGRQGFKMAVAGGELFGSIGGGVMEVSLVSQAKSKVQSSKTKVVEQTHRKDSPNSSGMICSGKQTVIFFELNFEHLETVKKVISSLENNHSKLLKISESRFQITEETPKDRIQNLGFNFKQQSKDEFLFEERLGYKNKLFIIGGGHCALAVSELISKMNFHISLFDDRPDLNTVKKNKFVQEIKIIESYEQIGEYIESGKNHYIVVMTLGYKFDEIVIRKLFNKDFKYFGVLGSKAKMAVLMRELEKDGLDKERLDRIYTPIGVSINSRTPEEIAVSIAAEIIAVKNSKG